MQQLSSLALTASLIAVLGCRPHPVPGPQEATGTSDMFSSLKRIPPAQIKSDFKRAAGEFPALLADSKRHWLVTPATDSKQNAAPEYEKAAKLFAALPDELKTNAFGRDTNGWKTTFEPTYVALKPILAQIEKGSRLRDFVLDGGDLNIPAMASLKTLCKIECRVAQYELSKKNLSGFEAHVRTAARISNHLGSPRSIVASLIQMVGMMWVQEVCEQALASQGSRKDVRLMVARILADLQTPTVNQATVAAEYESISSSLELSPEPGSKKLQEPFSEITSEEFSAACKTGLLSFGQKLITLLQDSTVLNPLETAARINKLSEDESSSKNAVDAFIGQFTGTWSDGYLVILKGRARTNLHLTSLRLYEGRGMENSFPKTLPDGSPVDPFTGRSLIYRKVAAGFLLYSVGMDGKDDGGDIKKDVVLQVPPL